MTQFKVGDAFESTDIFTGGTHEYKITDRTETKIICQRVYHEIDGTHKGRETFEIHTDNDCEYIVLWTYKGEEGRKYAESSDSNGNEEDYYESYDPCYGCLARDNSYNCKHCPHGDDGCYDSPFDVYTPSELGINVKW